MQTITVNIPNETIQIIKELVEMEIYPNKSECIREAIRHFLIQQGKL